MTLKEKLANDHLAVNENNTHTQSFIAGWDNALDCVLQNVEIIHIGNGLTMVDQNSILKGKQIEVQ